MVASLTTLKELEDRFRPEDAILQLECQPIEEARISYKLNKLFEKAKALIPVIVYALSALIPPITLINIAVYELSAILPTKLSMFLVALVVFGCYWHAIVQRLIARGTIFVSRTEAYKYILQHFLIITIEAIIPQKNNQYPHSFLKRVEYKPLKKQFHEVQFRREIIEGLKQEKKVYFRYEPLDEKEWEEPRYLNVEPQAQKGAQILQQYRTDSSSSNKKKDISPACLKWYIKRKPSDVLYYFSDTLEWIPWSKSHNQIQPGEDGWIVIQYSKKKHSQAMLLWHNVSRLLIKKVLALMLFCVYAAYRMSASIGWGSSGLVLLTGVLALVMFEFLRFGASLRQIVSGTQEQRLAYGIVSFVLIVWMYLRAIIKPVKKVQVSTVKQGQESGANVVKEKQLENGKNQSQKSEKQQEKPQENEPKQQISPSIEDSQTKKTKANEQIQADQQIQRSATLPTEPISNTSTHQDQKPKED